MTLLDTIILEGIAEYAVFERLGKPKQLHGRHITPKNSYDISRTGS